MSLERQPTYEKENFSQTVLLQIYGMDSKKLKNSDGSDTSGRRGGAIVPGSPMSSSYDGQSALSRRLRYVHPPPSAVVALCGGCDRTG